MTVLSEMIIEKLKEKGVDPNTYKGLGDIGLAKFYGNIIKSHKTKEASSNQKHGYGCGCKGCNGDWQ